MMKYGKHARLATIFIPILLAVGLQGCLGNTTTVKQNKDAALSQLSNAGTLKLFQKDAKLSLKSIGQGEDTFSKKPVNTIQSSLLRKTVLSTKRGKRLSTCRFPAIRIELDGKKETSDWLVTTKGKEHHCAGFKRYFWVIQMNKARISQILLQGRGDRVSIKKSINSAWRELHIRNRGHIKVEDGDKLANGKPVLITSADKGYIGISCKSKFRIQGNRYQPYEENVEANVVDWMYETQRFWEKVDNPRYRCPF